MPRRTEDPDATVESPAARPDREAEPVQPAAEPPQPAAGPPEPPRADPEATMPFEVIEPADTTAGQIPPPTVRRIPRPKPGTPAGEAEAAAAPPPAEPTRALPARPVPGTGASRLLGEPPQRQSAMEVWGPRLVAIALVLLLLVALGLIVRGVI
jgi:hypothetical protein